MATQTEVFRADLKFSVTGLVGTKTGAIKQLGTLNASLKKVTDSLQELESVRVSFRPIETQLDKFKSRIQDIEFTLTKKGGLSATAERSLREFASVFKDTFGDLESLTEQELQKAIKQAESSLGLLKGTVGSALRRISKDNLDIFSFIPESAEKAKRETVDKSPIPDLVKEVNRLLALIPEKNKKNIQELTSQFKELERRAIPDTSELTKTGTPRLGVTGNAARRMKTDLQSTIGELTKFLKSDLENLTASIESTFRQIPEKSSPEIIKLRAAFSELRKDAVKDIKEINEVSGKTAVGLAEVYKKVNEASDKIKVGRITKLQDEFDKLREAGDNTAVTLGKRMKGLSLAITQPGLRLQGFREALSGTTATSNLFIKGLDRMIAGGAEFGKVSDKLKGSIVEIAQSIDRSTRSLNSQVNVLRRVVKEEGVATDATDEFDKSLTKVDASFKQIQVTARTGGDISRGLSRARVEVEGLEQEYKTLVSSGIIPVGSASDKMFQNIIQQARNTESGLQAIGARYNTIRTNTKKAEEAGDDFSQSIKKQEAVSAGLFSKLASFFGRFKSGANEATKEVRQLDKQIQATTESANTLKTVLIAGLGGLGVGLVFSQITDYVSEATGAIIGFGSDVDKASKKAVARLGDIVENTEIVGNVITQVFRDNFGDSADEIGNSVTVILQQMSRLGDVSEKELIGVTEDVYRIRDAFDTDLNETINASATLVKTGLAPSFGDALDFITLGLQRGLNANNDFLDSISEYTVQAEDAGFTSAQWFNILDTGFQGGVLGTDKAVDAVKEFIDRIRDGSDTTDKALTRLGINADEFIGKLSSGAITGADAFEVVIEKLRAVDDQVALDQIGTALLGEQFKDAGRSGVLSLSTVGVELDDIAGKTAGLDKQYNTLGAVFSAIWKNLVSVFGPAGDSLLRIANRIAPLVISALNSIESVVDNIVTSFTKMSSGFIETITGIISSSELLTGALETLGLVIKLVLAGEWSTAWEAAKLSVLEALDGIFGLFDEFEGNAFDWGFGLMTQIGEGVLDAGARVIDYVIDIANQIASYLMPGSPPKSGPLSTIDRWGSGLLNTFTGGFDDFNTNFLTDIARSIRSALSDEALPEAGKLIQQLNTELRETGQLNETAFGNLKKLLGEDNKLLSDTIEASAKYEENRRNLIGIEQELLQAKVKGQDTSEIEGRLKQAKREFKIAQQSAKQKQEELALAEQFSGSRTGAGAGGSIAEIKEKTLEDELAANERRVKAGIITEEEALRQRERILRKFADKALEVNDEVLASELAAQANTLEEEVSNNEQQSQSAEETLEGELAALQEQLDLGIIDTEEAEQRKIALYRKYAEIARKDGDANLAANLAAEANSAEQAIEDKRQAELDATKDLREEQAAIRKAELDARRLAEKKTSLQIYQENLAILDQQLADGIISQKDYAKRRLQIEQTFYKSTLKEGKKATDENIANIKKYEALLESFKEKQGEGAAVTIGGEPLELDIFEPGKLVESAKEAGTTFVSSLSDTIQEKLSGIKDRLFGGLKETFSGTFTKLREYLLGISAEELFPVTLILGAIASPVLGPILDIILNPLALISGATGGVSAALSFLGTVLKFLGKIALKWSVIGLVVYGVITHWDEIVETVTVAIGLLAVPIIDLIEFITEFIAVFQKVGDFNEIITKIAGGFSLLASGAALVAGLVKKVFKVIFFGVIVGGATAAIASITKFSNYLIAAFGGMERFVQSLSAAILEIATAFHGVTKKVFDFINVLFVGDFQVALKSITDIPEVIRQAFAGEALAGFMAKIGDAIRRILPEGLVEGFDALRQGIKDFFSEGRLGSEVLLLLQELWEALRNIVFENKEMFIAMGVAIGAVAAIVANVLVSALQTIIDVLPFIERALSGVIRVIRGVVQNIEGIILFIRALIAIFIDLVTGSDTSGDLFARSMEKFQQAAVNVLGGLIQAVSSIAAGAITAVVAFIGNLYANAISVLAKFIGVGSEELAQGIRDWIGGFVGIGTWLIDTIRNIVNEVAGWFQWLFNLLLGNSIVPDLIYGIIDMFGVLKDNVMAYVVPFMRVLVTVIGGAFQKVWDVIQNTLIPAFARVKEVIVAVLITSTNRLGLAFTIIRDVLVNAVIPALQRIWRNLVTTGKMMLEILKPAIVTLLETLDALGINWGTLAEFAKAVLIPILIAIGAVIATVVAAIIGFITGFANALATFITGVSNFVSGVTSIIEGLLVIFSGFKKIITGIFTGDLALIFEGAEVILQGFETFVGGILQTIAGLFQATFGTITGFVEGFIEGVVTLFVGLYTELVGNSIVPDMMAEIIRLFTELPNKVFAQIQILIDGIIAFGFKFIDVGTSIAGGILSGIKSAWSGITSFINESLTDLVNTITDTLSGPLGSLSGTGTGFSLPGFATGAFDVPRDMAAMIHKGEMILPADIANQIRGGVTNLPGDVTTDNSSAIDIDVNVILEKGMTRSDGLEIGRGIGDGLAGELRSIGAI